MRYIEPLKTDDRTIFRSPWMKGVEKKMNEVIEAINGEAEGKVKIEEEPWPTHGDIYYVPCFSNGRLYEEWKWNDDIGDTHIKSSGMAFRTKEEAAKVASHILIAATDTKSETAL